VSTIRNGDAQKMLRFRTKDRPMPMWQPDRQTATHDSGLVQSYSPKEFRMEVSLDGTINIYKRQCSTTSVTADERISLGIEDPRPSKLRELRERLQTPAAINQRNTEFYEELERNRRVE
jgi:hypothetical protein